MITIIPRQVTTEEEDQPDPAFISVGEAIEHFGTQLAGSRELSETDAELLHQLRAGLSLTRHLEEAVREYCQNLAQDPKDALPFEHALSSKLEDVLTEAGNAMDSLEIQKINSLRDHTRRSNPALIAIRNNVTNSQIQRSPSDGARTVELLDHFELSIWLLHRFVKVMEDLKEQFNKR